VVCDRDIVPIPPGGAPGGDALGAFVSSVRPWSRVPVPLPPGLATAVGAVALVNLVVGGWAVTVLMAGWSCTGFLCAMSTLGGRPALLLALTAGCVLATVLLAASTGGLARAGGGQLAALALTSTVGVVAAVGAVLALVLAALVVAAAVLVLIALIERI
jgi:hypothetical protein